MPDPTEPFLLQFFRYEHLRPDLADISRRFADLAQYIATLPSNAEQTRALRKVLEAKDCAVRAYIAGERISLHVRTLDPNGDPMPGRGLIYGRTRGTYEQTFEVNGEKVDDFGRTSAGYFSGDGGKTSRWPQAGDHFYAGRPPDASDGDADPRRL